MVTIVSCSPHVSNVFFFPSFMYTPSLNVEFDISTLEID